jgi:hypothetical protein
VCFAHTFVVDFVWCIPVDSVDDCNLVGT